MLTDEETDRQTDGRTDSTRVIYMKDKRQQESAAYATVSARQCRHLANTFEVAAIECLTSVAT